jgi:acyl-CoA thioesterase
MSGVQRHAFNLAQTRALIPQMPFNHHLGLHVLRMFKDGLALECELRPEMQNGHGTLHGGVTASLVDAAIGIAAIALSGGRRLSTVDLKVTYLRPALEGKLHCRAHLVKSGRTLVFGEAKVRAGHGKVVATGQATYIYLEESAEDWDASETPIS